MAEPFLGEIRMLAFNFAPVNWAFCNGEVIPIQQNTALYSLLGNQFGGDGRTTFALPDLRSRVPMHPGSGYYTGMMGGAESVTLDGNTLAAHTHTLAGISEVASGNAPSGQMLADSGEDPVYATTALTPMNPGALTATGGGLAHPNIQPYETVNFCIALVGIYPSRN